MTDTDTSAPPRIVLTKPKRGGGSNPTTAYSGLLNTVREAGLLERRVGFYVLMFAGITAALVGLGIGFVALGDSWFQLLIAAGLGIIFTQFAFLAHEASHRQVFESGKANDIAGRTLANLFVGISYSWWMTKHSRHHANPNVMARTRTSSATSSPSPPRTPLARRGSTAGSRATRATRSSPS
ncbi:Fatty acid desaturase [Clavibacter michiganensis subsp. michiganensis]|uniref:Fatty acid desaturase n=1 Tax=Clavibacter michiganensis subsp. michiganensis TaxID=33013 RepID=A0A251XG81_CLAMM|nr:Fatty acid desaturase [Clavibacter michiganensis subsp. michiganensis]OUE01441.1 Fatty acid desaturase [Clavibacter michiganensis subsp. michiganensis]